jgi:hypothetical protein
MDNTELKAIAEILMKWAVDRGLNPDAMTLGEVARMLDAYEGKQDAKLTG